MWILSFSFKKFPKLNFIDFVSEYEFTNLGKVVSRSSSQRTDSNHPVAAFIPVSFFSFCRRSQRLVISGFKSFDFEKYFFINKVSVLLSKWYKYVYKISWLFIIIIVILLLYISEHPHVINMNSLQDCIQ